MRIYREFYILDENGFKIVNEALNTLNDLIGPNGFVKELNGLSINSFDAFDLDKIHKIINFVKPIQVNLYCFDELTKKSNELKETSNTIKTNQYEYYKLIKYGYESQSVSQVIAVKNNFDVINKKLLKLIK